MAPKTRYARSGDIHIAYQVVGDGPIDVVYVPTWISHIELLWEEPMVERFFSAIASFSRLIVFDRRGSGLSDPVTSPPTLEEQMDDVLAVLDAAGSEKASIFAHLEGGPMAILFAAVVPGAHALAGALRHVRAHRADRGHPVGVAGRGAREDARDDARRSGAPASGFRRSRRASPATSA